MSAITAASDDEMQAEIDRLRAESLKQSIGCNLHSASLTASNSKRRRSAHEH